MHAFHLIPVCYQKSSSNNPTTPYDQVRIHMLADGKKAPTYSPTTLLLYFPISQILDSSKTCPLE